MGSFARNIIKGNKDLRKRRKTKVIRPDTENMIPKTNLILFRFMMFAFFAFAIVLSGYAPNKSPKLPEGVSLEYSLSRSEGRSLLTKVFILTFWHHWFLSRLNLCLSWLTDLRKQFCEHGDVTATTGECMCHWQHKVCIVMLNARGWLIGFCGERSSVLMPHTHTIFLHGINLSLRTVVWGLNVNTRWDYPFIIILVRIASVWKNPKLNEYEKTKSKLSKL